MRKSAWKGLIAALICLLVMSGSALAANPPKIVKGKDGKSKFMVFNKTKGKYEQFMVKGVAYKPVPLGRNDADPNYGGAQLCYPIYPTAWGVNETWSPCWDSDYSSYLVSASSGKVLDASFKKLWERDFKIFKQMGVNTIRLYDTDPQFRDHITFLDFCENAGIKVIYPLWITTETMRKDWPVTDQDPKPETWWLPLMDGIKKQIAEVGKHPAILCFVAGNEAFNVNPLKPEQQYIIDRIKLVMEYTASNSKIPVTTCTSDLGADEDNWFWYINTFTKAALMMVNSGYRGDACVNPGGYERLWNILEKVSKPDLMPFLLGECGVYDNLDKGYNRRNFNCFLKSADQNRARTNFMGVVYFEYSDEKDKGDKNSNEKQMGVLKPELATTIPDNRIPDKLIPKKESYKPNIGWGRWEMFQPYQSGDPEVAKYNYHDIWK